MGDLEREVRARDGREDGEGRASDKDNRDAGRREDGQGGVPGDKRNEGSRQSERIGERRRRAQRKKSQWRKRKRTSVANAGALCTQVTGGGEAKEAKSSDAVSTGPTGCPTADTTTRAHVVMAADAHGRFVPMTVNAEIGGVRVRPLVDTGAGVSLIHATTLEQLQAHDVKCVVHQRRSAWIVGVNGNELTTLGFMRLPVTLGGVTQAIEFHVVLACPASVLLGTGALHEFGVGIQFDERVLVLPDGGKVLFLVTADASTRYGVFVAEELTLDPRSITRVHV
jgi:hypothetical protein